ncbi:MAG: thioredoxin family protein [Nevskia sp.]|nr:thioredoxin family protein [Nevskia sp.]
MTAHPIVSHTEWTAARRQLLAREKEFTRLRDQLSRQRRELPWEPVEQPYVFEGEAGKVSLAELFAGRSQLVVYHFMFAPEWELGCKSCSFWADNFNGIVPHLNARDVSFAAISRAPLAKLQAQARRLGWTFKWVSSAGTGFNYDYQVSFTPEALAGGQAIYNYEGRNTGMQELPGISVFFKGDDGRIYHTYSCYGRGLDMLNTAYNYLDLVPKGRDEDGLSSPMAWVRLRDAYGA